MSFLNPLLLIVGLAALAIPVLVHLQRRRQRVRVVFSTLKLVNESQRITRRRRRITDWPILLLRLLAIGLLAFGFGRPWLSSLASNAPGHKESVVFVLDLSASMQASGEVGPVWDEGMAAFERALGDQHPDSRVAIVTSPADADSIAQVSWMTPRQLRSVVAKLAPGYGRANLAAALNRAAGVLNRIEPDLPKVIHLISDLQNDALRNLERVSLPADMAVRVTKVGDLEPYNAGWEVAAKGTGELRRGLYGLQVPSGGFSSLGQVTVQDFGPNGESQGEAVEVQLQPGTLTASQSYLGSEQGWFSRNVRLIQEDALAVDNLAYDAFYVQSRVNVLLIEPQSHAEAFNQATFFFSRALDPFLGVEDVSKRPTRFHPKTTQVRNSGQALRQLDPSNSVVFLPALDGLSGELAASLKQFVKAGGGLVMFSGEPLRPQIYNQYLGDVLPVAIGDSQPIEIRATIEFIGQSHPLWGGLDLSNRQKMVRLPLFRRSETSVHEDATVLARFGDGQPLVTERTFGKGRALFVNTSATRNWGDWPTMAGTYVPTIHVLAARALPRTENVLRDADVLVTLEDGLSFNVGKRFAGKSLRVQDAESEAESDVDVDGHLVQHAPIAPGIYTVRDNDNKVIKRYAVNLDPRESNLESTHAVVVKRQLESQRTQTQAASINLRSAENNDAIIWKTLLATLAIVLAFEPFLANHA